MFRQQEVVRKKQRLVLRQAGRKCFLFQSVLYPLVIKKETRKKEGKLLKSTKKVYPAPGAGCPLLMSFHKHFVHLSGWWGGWTAYWTAAWSLGQFLNGTSNSTNMNYPPTISLWPHVVLLCSVANHGGTLLSQEVTVPEFGCFYCCHCSCRSHNYSVEEVHLAPMRFSNIY